MAPGLAVFETGKPQCLTVFVERDRLHATRTALGLTLCRCQFQSVPGGAPWRVLLRYRVRIGDACAVCHRSGHVTEQQCWAVRIPSVTTWPVVPVQCAPVRRETPAGQCARHGSCPGNGVSGYRASESPSGRQPCLCVQGFRVPESGAGLERTPQTLTVPPFPATLRRGRSCRIMHMLEGQTGRHSVIGAPARVMIPGLKCSWISD